MSEFETPHYGIGIFIGAAALLYAAWYEFKRRNRRDPKLLAAAGSLSIAGTLLVMIEMTA